MQSAQAAHADFRRRLLQDYGAVILGISHRARMERGDS